MIVAVGPGGGPRRGSRARFAPQQNKSAVPVYAPRVGPLRQATTMTAADADENEKTPLSPEQKAAVRGRGADGGRGGGHPGQTRGHPAVLLAHVGGRHRLPHQVWRRDDLRRAQGGAQRVDRKGPAGAAGRGRRRRPQREEPRQGGSRVLQHAGVALRHKHTENTKFSRGGEDSGVREGAERRG